MITPYLTFGGSCKDATFFAEAPSINPNASKITGAICGVRVETIDDPLVTCQGQIDGKGIEGLMAMYIGRIIGDRGRSIDMTLKEAIFKRKSTRKYHPDQLDGMILRDIEGFAATVKPLYPGIKTRFSIIGSKGAGGMVNVKAPHYLVISSENKRGHYVNAGFMLQQADLFLSSLGLGSCWLAMGSVNEGVDADKEYVIMLAFGKADGSPHRELAEFKRKPLAEITDAADERLEVMRLAPTARNLQNFYFTHADGAFHAYCGKAGFLMKKTFKKLHEIDIGIAFAHLYIANADSFKFFDDANVKELPGYYYCGSVRI